MPLKMRAHPRSRGENGRRRFAPGTPVGSSPLTRGKHSDAAPIARDQRLIPAHAGKTAGLQRSPRHRGAHPRSRGENWAAHTSVGFPDDSSPLTRGKLESLLRSTRNGGLIPAHAGKTVNQSTRRPPSAAHPRSRGENRQSRHSNALTGGSSPLTRGKHVAHRVERREIGLIPAHAGKTRDGVLKSMSIGAHPRSRGENM